MLQGDYLGMTLTIDDVDKENQAFFNYCAKGDFRLQKGKKSGTGKDMHAIFAASKNANGSRGNMPFGMHSPEDKLI